MAWAAKAEVTAGVGDPTLILPLDDLQRFLANSFIAVTHLLLIKSFNYHQAGGVTIKKAILPAAQYRTKECAEGGRSVSRVQGNGGVRCVVN
jgi:hypothetical protein